jgi:RNA-directed DNA polymerase
MITRKPLPLRGGSWNNGSNAGLGALNANNPRSNSNSNIGFRPALDNARSSHLKGYCQCNNEKDELSTAIAEIQIKPVDASAGSTFERIYDFENILSAAYSCRKGKTTGVATLKFFDNLEENIIQIQNEMMWDMYKASSYHYFYVFEPKRRLISAPNFRDRVVHRAIYNIVEPLFDKTYIYDSYACRRDKGTHRGADRAQQFIRQVEHNSGRAYALKADIKRYFSSIDHAVLKSILSAKIQCSRTIDLLFYIIDSSPCDSDGTGIPLGNLTSQIFANVYLNELDRFIKHRLKVKRYVRYMDDFVIIHHDKNQLTRWRCDIEDFINQNLKLETNAKTQIFPISVEKGRGLDFLGYRIYSHHRLLRKSSVKSIKTKLKKYRNQYFNHELSISDVNKKIQSWLGHASHADSYNLRRALLAEPFTRATNV